MKNLLKKFRKAAGLSQETLAERAGVHQSTVQRHEQRDLFPDNLREICAILNIMPVDLLLPEDNPHRPLDKNEAALLGMFRELNATMQRELLSSAYLMMKARKGELTEAEFQPRFPELLEQLREELRNNATKSRTKSALSEDV